MQYIRKSVSVFEDDNKRLDEIKKATGAAHSAIIRIAVKEYHKKLLKGK